MQNDKVWTKNFLLIIIINFLVFMNHIMILSTFPMFLEQVLGLNAAMAGLAAFGFSAVAGYTLSAAVSLALTCRMLHGAALALSNTTGATIASDALPQRRFAEGMGYFGMATALATSVAPALGLAAISAPSSFAHNDV